jgi:hypothetical protein
MLWGRIESHVDLSAWENKETGVILQKEGGRLPCHTQLLAPRGRDSHFSPVNLK